MPSPCFLLRLLVSSLKSGTSEKSFYFAINTKQGYDEERDSAVPPAAPALKSNDSNVTVLELSHSLSHNGGSITLVSHFLFIEHCSRPDLLPLPGKQITLSETSDYAKGHFPGLTF